MATISCETHGTQDETLVCVHIVDTLQDGEPRGFHWNLSEGAYQAICSMCNELTPDQFQAAEKEIVREVCFGCFQEAAAIHGVDLDESLDE